MQSNGIKIALCATSQRIGFAICQSLERLVQIESIKVFLDPVNDPVRLMYRGECLQVETYNSLENYMPDIIIYAGKAFNFNAFHSQFNRLNIPMLNLSWGLGVENLILEPNDENIYQMKHPITQQLYLPLSHIDKLSKIETVNICVACGADIEGEDGILELMNQTKAYMSYDEEYFNVFPKPIAFNSISDISVDETTGYDACRRMMTKELKQALKNDLSIDMSFMQLPVIQGHHAVVHVTSKNPIDMCEVGKSFESDPLLHHVNLVSNREYAQCFNRVAISQIKQHPEHNRGISFHVLADELAFGIKQYVLHKVTEMFEITEAM
ncbi:MAG: Asd/ArgC dimerization domain-containing protein [Pseudomonadota bacterium]|nr:Asd/ArgC dimerization domain-containing protein [Pseudomonadota bacterium]